MPTERKTPIDFMEESLSGRYFREKTNHKNIIGIDRILGDHAYQIWQVKSEYRVRKRPLN